MKKIILWCMTLENFKGIKSFHVNFNETETTIAAENGVGKTTLFDAFTWALFDKNSQDDKSFSIKTLMPSGEPINKIDHAVSLLLSIDGVGHNFKKVYSETWTKKRGSEVAEMSGHSTDYFINDVPHKASEYSAFIMKNIEAEYIVKLSTNPLFFNSDKNLDWKKRREILFSIAGDTKIDLGEFLASKIDPSKDIDKQIADLNQSTAYKKKQLKKEIDEIPTRIDEVVKGKPEAVDFDEVRKEHAELLQEKSNVEGELQDKYKREEGERNTLAKLHSDRHAASMNLVSMKNSRELEASKIQQKTNNEIANKEAALRIAKETCSVLIREREEKARLIEHVEKENDALREKWKEKAAESISIPSNSTICPCCNRELENPELIIEKLQADYRAKKERELQLIHDEGVSNSHLIEQLKLQKEDREKGIVRRQDEIKSLEESLFNLKGSNFVTYPSQEETAISNEIKSLDEAIANRPKFSDQEYKDRLDKIENSISQLSAKLDIEKRIEEADARIKELGEQESTLAQQIADLERIEFATEKYNTDKITAITSKINSWFSGGVRFRFFRPQINGGQEEVCECLVNGVPFSDANTAGKINAGLQCINVLSQHFQIQAPIWIDNRESVTSIVPVKSQVINLFKDETKKSLTVL